MLGKMLVLFRIFYLFTKMARMFIQSTCVAETYTFIRSEGSVSGAQEACVWFR